MILGEARPRQTRQRNRRFRSFPASGADGSGWICRPRVRGGTGV